MGDNIKTIGNRKTLMALGNNTPHRFHNYTILDNLSSVSKE